MSEEEKLPDGETPRAESSNLTSASALRAHVTLLFVLAFCALAFWFELGRAESGNHLSWAYVFEWPLLAHFAIYMWWKILHPDFTWRKRVEKPSVAPEYQGMLLAWQAEQRRLGDDRTRDGANGTASPRPSGRDGDS